MKKVKRIIAMLIAMVMVMGMCMTAFAEQGKTPSAADTAKAEVENVEKGATVTAYRIIGPTYENGFKGYEVVETVKSYLSDVDMTPNAEDPAKPKKGPSAEQVKNIAKLISDGTITGLDNVVLSDYQKNEEATDAEEGTYSAQLGAGYWVVIVENTGETIYNPMLLGVYYSTADGTLNNDLTGGIVNANGNWDLTTENVYAKSSKTSIDKKIISPSGSITTDNEVTDNGADVAVGDTVQFEVDTQIPAYSSAYKTVQYIITDTLSAGLTSDRNPVVKVDSTKVEASADTFTVSYSDDGKVMTINFASDYALANAGKPVVVTYSATLNDKAGQNFDMNSNTAKLTYSNDPTDASSVKKLEDKTYTYTFAIDANLNGEDGEQNEWVTEELKKVDADKWETVTENGKEIKKYTTPLAGAEFKLTSKADAKKVYTATSDDKGRISFTGLDAGEYTLVETKAPAGYSVNTKEIPVVISATYNDDGTLARYEITINGDVTSTYTATYEGTTVVNKVVKTLTNGTVTHDLLNTKLTNLPSTGGIGTYIFTVVGIIIMAVSAAYFFVSRRRTAK